MLCCAGTYKSGRPSPKASANATQTRSTHGDRERTPIPAEGGRLAVRSHVPDCRRGDT